MRLKVGQSRLPVEIFSKFAVNEIAVSVDGLEKDVICRLHDSDPEVFNQIFVRHDYEHHTMPNDAQVIIDAGANVGYSVLYFKKKYPNATILALEPDPANYKVLCRNCAHLPNVILLNAALWKKDTMLALQFESDEGHNLHSWGVRTQAISTISDNVVQTKAYDIPTLMAMYQFEKIDICKVDIEGAEKEVFQDSSATWYKKVEVFVIETHDRFAKGADAAVKASLSAELWQYERKGENQFFKQR